MKSMIPILTGLFVAGSLLQAQETKLVDETFLSTLRTEAARNHPAAISAKFRAAAAASDTRSLRLWDDPMVGLAVMAAGREMRRDDGDIRISLEQALPKPGLFAANRSKAEALERAESEISQSSLLEVGAAAAKDAIELALADESIALQATQITWLESMTENAREMSINPDATSADALRLESELAREKQILQAARRTRDGIAQSLNLRLGHSLDSPWPTLRLTTNPAPVPVASSEIARIPRVNPKVRSMKEMAAAANSEIRIANSERQPQFSVAVESAIYSGGDVRSADVGLKMSLPFFNRVSYDAKIQASQLREKAAITDIETTRLEIASGVISAVTDAANANAQARAYSGEIHQRALAATQSVESSWISSKATLTDLLDSNRTLFSIKLEQRRFVAMQLAALENLNLLVPRK
jgi:outer membrane protein, heavy metal efflux system